jgi:protein-S-isoprenylcysteine O-methyltransferase Ste14
MRLNILMKLRISGKVTGSTQKHATRGTIGGQWTQRNFPCLIIIKVSFHNKNNQMEYTLPIVKLLLLLVLIWALYIFIYRKKDSLVTLVKKPVPDLLFEDLNGYDRKDHLSYLPLYRPPTLPAPAYSK